jgi:hypothetical protein
MMPGYTDPQGHPQGWTQRQQDSALLEMMRLDRASWDAHYREINSYFLPRSGRWITSDVNDGKKRHQKVIDSTPLRAIRTGAAGLSAGATSPAKQWFQIRAGDPDLAKYHSTRVWCDEATWRVHRVFNKGNTYRAFSNLYHELFAYGTGTSLVVPDHRTVIHHHPMTVGQYFLHIDYRGHVTTFAREFEKTVSELVMEFGLDNCSRRTRQLWEDRQFLSRVVVVHLITPRAFFDPGKLDAKNMAWRSVYYEPGVDEGGPNKVLRESGFRHFPVLAPRWTVTPGDTYGGSPAMECLGDAKELYHLHLGKGQLIDLDLRPPINVPPELKGKLVSLLPGGKNHSVQAASGAGGVKPVFQPQQRLDGLLQNIYDVRDRINQTCFVDMFLMLHQGQDRPQKTATEVAELHSEKLLMLGPVLENLQTEMQEPAVRMAFDALVSNGMMPPPPPELEGAVLEIEFVGMLAQAQKQAGLASIERFTANLLALGQGGKPEVLDVLDGDAWTAEMADILGVPTKLLEDEKEVAAIREARAKQMQAQAQAAAAQQVAGAVRDFAQAGVTTEPQDQFTGL